ncbi:AAEL010748-PA [Aedes aegypti]|uniref:AAEL010748-PA n=1 Tax=Aedes aegypti TaxID=7159 RepID=Q0IEF3_AEDAE|nr:AAEL010748-PA [Aedes aegypti]
MLLRCMRPYPLLWACEENFEELAVHLIKKDPNVVNVTTKKYKETALHFAAAQGHVKLCTLLIENKLDVNVQNVHNQTALHKAAYNGYDEVVKLLLERQANASALDNLQQTPLFSAALAGHSSIVQLLIGKHPNLNSLNKRGWGAVHIAAINNHTDVVRILLSRKVKIKSGKAKRWTGFLGMLLNRGHREMVELLVTYEVRSNAGTNETLFWAIRRNHIEVVRTLHRAGASINETDDRSGLSTYQLALKEGSFKIAEYILATHNSSEMPEDALHMAAEVGSVTCVSILLNSKAEVNVKNHKGESPLGLALKNSHVGVVQLLLEKSARITENMLVYAIGVNKPGSIDCAKELLLHGANPSAVYEPTGQSALHLAVLVNHYECTKLLLQRGASCHHIDKRGRTPLHYMAVGRCTYALRAFVEETVGFRNIRNMKQLIHMKDQYLGETVLSSAQSYYPEFYNILKHFDVN